MRCRRVVVALWQVKTSSARRLYQGLLSNYGDNEKAMWARRGIVFVDIRLGNFEAAGAGIDAMVGAYPGHDDLPQAMQWLGNDFYKAKEYEKAVGAYGYVVDNALTSQYALGSQKGVILSRVRLGDDPNTNAAIDDLFVKFKGRGDVARAAAEVADESRRDLKAYAPARKLYEGLLGRYPESKQAMRAQRGIVNIDIKTANYEAAAEGVQTLLTKYANHADLPQAFYWLGNDYLDARQNENAADCYQYTIENRPGSSEAMSSWAGMGRVHIRHDDHEAAHNVIDKIIADFNDAPDLADALFKIGDEYYKMAFVDPNKCKTIKSEENLNRAKGVFEKIIAQCPQSKSIGLQHANYFLAVSYRKLGKHDKAVGYYQKVVDKWPEYQFAWSAQCLIGECYEKLRSTGRLAESEANPKIVEAYKAVIEEYPDCSLVGHACLKLGNINFKASQWDEAARYFGLFLEECPEDIQQATALYHLGKTYEEMGESDTAVEVYRMFLERADPADRRIAIVRTKLDKLGGQKQ